MTKKTNYELLKDVYDVVNRLETKLDKRIRLLEKKVDDNSSFINNVQGKIAVFILLVSAVMSYVFEYIFNKGR